MTYDNIKSDKKPNLFSKKHTFEKTIGAGSYFRVNASGNFRIRDI